MKHDRVSQEAVSLMLIKSKRIATLAFAAFLISLPLTIFMCFGFSQRDAGFYSLMTTAFCCFLSIVAVFLDRSGAVHCLPNSLANFAYDGIDRVERNVIRHFKAKCPIEFIDIIDYGDNRLWGVVFFKTNKDLDTHRQNGLFTEITDFVHKELERVGRGKPAVITMTLEFDSDENVRENFGGSYHLRFK